MSSPIILATYHPAAILHAGKSKAGDKGLSKEAILRAIEEDLQRVLYILDTSTTGTVLLPEPLRVQGTVPKGAVLGVDTEYIPETKTLLTSSFSDGTTVTDWDIDLYPNNPFPLETDVQVLVGHNLPEDVALLWEHGQIPRRPEFLTGQNLVDTLLLARMVYEGQASYKLEDLLASLYTVNPWKHKTSSKDVTKWTPQERVERCGLDAWAPIHLAKKHWPLLDSHAQHSLFPFTMATAMTLHRLTLAGAFVNPHDLTRLIESKQNRRLLLNAKLVQAATHLGLDTFSPSNDGQIREILFQKLGLPVLERTPKTKEPKVTKEVLDLLAEGTEGDTKSFIETLREFNKIDKTLTTYLAGGITKAGKESKNAIAKLAKALQIERSYPNGVPSSPGTEGSTIVTRLPNGVELSKQPLPVFASVPSLWLPFHFHVLGAKTARRSSSNPNSQNWPKEIRRLVQSRWPGGKILAADYRKLEPVIIAWLAQDERLLEYFTTGNGYLGIAKDLLRTEVKEGTDLYRGVKSIVLGVHYDMGTDEMALQLWRNHKIRFSVDWETHWDETDRIRTLYLATYPAIGQYMQRRRDEARATGAVRTPTGRVRTVGSQFVDKHILNQAINAPVQSTASDVTGSALVDCERVVLAEYGIELTAWYDHLITQRRKYLTSGGTYGIISEQWRVPTLFNEVHDELTWDLPPENLKRNVELIIETMRSVPTLRRLAPYLKDMPLYVDPKVGNRWGEGE